MEEFKIDIAALFIEAMNTTQNKMLLGAVKGEAERKQFHKILTAFNKRGVSTQTILDALMEAFTEE